VSFLLYCMNFVDNPVDRIGVFLMIHNIRMSTIEEL